MPRTLPTDQPLYYLMQKLLLNTILTASIIAFNGCSNPADDVAEAILSLIGGSDLITGHVVPVEAGILIGTS